MNRNIYELIDELESRSKAIRTKSLKNEIEDRPLEESLFNLANRPADLDKVSNAVDLLEGKGHNTRDNVKSLLSSHTHYGAFHELMTYDSLNRYQVNFDVQLSLTNPDVLNPKGSILDGKISELDCYFDIKSMGFADHVAEEFKKALAQKLYPLDVTISGNFDVGVGDISTHAFGQLPQIITLLESDGSATIPELGWRIEARTKKKVSTFVKEINPEIQAFNNRFFPFKGARQFTTNKPFMLIFPFAPQFNQVLSMNFAGSTAMMFQELSRIVFCDLTEELGPVETYDSSLDRSISISDCCKLIAGMIFINLNTDHTWIYLNSGANHKLNFDDVCTSFRSNSRTNLQVITI